MCIGTHSALKTHLSKRGHYIEFAIPTMVAVKGTMLWVLVPCSSVDIHKYYKQTYKLHLQG
jgi:hypothetical protein